MKNNLDIWCSLGWAKGSSCSLGVLHGGHALINIKYRIFFFIWKFFSLFLSSRRHPPYRGLQVGCADQ
jgi:hypothetical protein